MRLLHFALRSGICVSLLYPLLLVVWDRWLLLGLLGCSCSCRLIAALLAEELLQLGLSFRRLGFVGYRCCCGFFKAGRIDCGLLLLDMLHFPEAGIMTV